jgi:sigma-E factor negative regulatory protein RseC
MQNHEIPLNIIRYLAGKILILCTFIGIMSQKETIRHEGIVEHIEADICRVRILQASACSGCSARQLCRSSESKEKIVEASLNGLEVQVGENVNVEGTVVQGLRAVYICYLIPLLLMVVSLFIGVKMGGDLTGILLSLAVLAVYYAVLYVFRNNIGKHFGFIVKKISNNENN